MSQHLQEQNTVMTAARQTMTTWSRVIESRNDIPPVYKNSFDASFSHEDPFPYTIFTPRLDKYPRKTTEKLVCDTNDVLHIFEKNGNQVRTISYPYRDIGHMETGIVLLDSWLTISGRTMQGAFEVSTIHFNTTSLRYFAGILKKLRPAPNEADAAQSRIEKDKFNHLSSINFKFMNYGRESLIPGETVLQILHQPEIRQPRLTLFGKTFHRTVCLAHIAILTDQELILIQDAERNAKAKTSGYGGVWRYIPLRSISSLTLSNSEDERVTLSIHSPSHNNIEILFENSSQPQLEQFCSQLHTCIGNMASS